MDTCQVTIGHGGQKQTLALRRGLGLQVLAAKFATPLEFDCRNADCGICIIKVCENPEALSPMKFPERDFLRAMAADSDERLACQCRVQGDVTISVEF